jgi:hypothetical protein
MCLCAFELGYHTFETHFHSCADVFIRFEVSFKYYFINESLKVVGKKIVVQ